MPSWNKFIPKFVPGLKSTIQGICSMSHFFNQLKEQIGKKYLINYYQIPETSTSDNKRIIANLQ